MATNSTVHPESEGRTFESCRVHHLVIDELDKELRCWIANHDEQVRRKRESEKWKNHFKARVKELEREVEALQAQLR